MKKKLLALSTILCLLTLLFVVLTALYDQTIFYSLAITFGTTFYHFAMRLMVGVVMNGIIRNQVDYRKKWFQEKKWEVSIYKKIKVKRWKNKMPTFSPEYFDVKKHSLEEIIKAGCQAEVVHEVIAVLSFVPVLFSVVFEELGVFLITSLIAALMDMIFVIMQRYNRPRLIKLIRR